MAKCFLFNWKALSFLSPFLVFHSGHDPGVEIERNMNRMQKVSVKKHQSHRSLLSLLPTPLLSCLDHLVSSRLPTPFRFPAILAWCLSIRPSPRFFCIPLHHTFWNHGTTGFPHPPPKGDLHLEKGLHSKAAKLLYKKTETLPCQEERRDFGEPRLAGTPCVCMGAPRFCSLTDSNSWYF